MIASTSPEFRGPRSGICDHTAVGFLKWSRTYQVRLALCPGHQLLRHLGFDERTRGSHHLFRKSDITELMNLQREGSKANVYQMRQVLAVLLKYRLAGKGGED